MSNITRILSNTKTDVSHIFIDTSLLAHKDGLITRIMVACSRFFHAIFGMSDGYNKAEMARNLERQIQWDAKQLSAEQKIILTNNLRKLQTRLGNQDLFKATISSLSQTPPKSIKRNKDLEIIFDREQNFTKTVSKNLQKEIKSCADCKTSLNTLMSNLTMTKLQHIESLQNLENKHLKEQHTDNLILEYIGRRNNLFNQIIGLDNFILSSALQGGCEECTNKHYALLLNPNKIEDCDYEAGLMEIIAEHEQGIHQ